MTKLVIVEFGLSCDNLHDAAIEVLEGHSTANKVWKPEVMQIQSQGNANHGE
jgi:hypothetical protein